MRGAGPNFASIVIALVGDESPKAVRFVKRLPLLSIVALSLLLGASSANAHPHMLAEAELTVDLSAPGTTLKSLKHVWHFDDVSSSMFLMDLDLNGDLKLDAHELKEGGKVMLESMAEYNYFQLVTSDGKDVAMNPPTEIFPAWKNNRLTITFETTPKQPTRIGGKTDIGVYDPTFYVAIDFLEDKQIKVVGLSPGCESHVIRPDPDEAIAQNQGTLTEAFFNDPAGNDLGKIFATRLELACKSAG